MWKEERKEGIYGDQVTPRRPRELCSGCCRGVWTWIRHLLLLLFSHLVSDSAIPWTKTHQAPLSFTVSWSLLKFMSTSNMD